MRVDYDELLALPADERFPAALAEARREGLIPAETPESFIRRLVNVGEANVRVDPKLPAAAACAPVHLFVPETKGGLAEVSGREMPDDRGPRLVGTTSASHWSSRQCPATISR